jgi:integrase
LDPGEIRALIECCADLKGPVANRDAAIISLMYAAGLRREEVVNLDLADYDGATGRLIVRHGKGDKERQTYIPGGAADALEAWLECRGVEPGPLFLPVLNRSIHWRRLKAQTIYDMLQRRAIDAKVSHFSPHDLRRTFISDLLDAGADIATVSKMAGHANIQTTARYDRRPEQAKIKAAGLLHVPYKRAIGKTS